MTTASAMFTATGFRRDSQCSSSLWKLPEHLGTRAKPLLYEAWSELGRSPVGDLSLTLNTQPARTVSAPELWQEGWGEGSGRRKTGVPGKEG